MIVKLEAIQFQRETLVLLTEKEFRWAAVFTLNKSKERVSPYIYIYVYVGWHENKMAVSLDVIAKYYKAITRLGAGVTHF